MSILRLTGIAKRFGATVALDGVDLDVAPGEVHAIIGENGAGKSTLMNVISRALQPDAGTIAIDAEVAHIHQELALCPHLPIAENIFLGREPRPRRAMFPRASELLARLGRGELDPRARTGRLPLADQQIVEICRALATDARVILMDEPTSSLQRRDVEELFALIRQLRTRGIAVIYISHFLEEVREIADRFTVLRDGRSVMTGTIAEVSDEQLIAAMAARHPERSEGSQDARSSHLEILRSAQDDVMLEVENLQSPPRLHNASFSLQAGEILGIAGLIGSGRTELIRTLFGLSRATNGRVMLRGQNITNHPSSKQIAHGLGYLSEDRKHEGLALQLAIADNVTMSRLPSRAGWIDRTRQHALAQRVMDALRVKAPSPATRVLRLSGGNQQKVALARLLHQDPDVLLLDEPARGIDVGSKADIYREIERLAAEGKAILMVSSYLPELLAVCDRIAVMSRGRLSPARPASEWTQESILEAAI
ncbi:MAG TPA: sugar ABC transporter ATP-binding protein [Thermoanaerobaculia bacterium]|nr:sugar ABC transporter ATP-binding protein [Thermoanaerobaculia bacterium]